MIEYYNRHNRLASACPLSNLSPIFGPSIKRKIERREAVTEQRQERVISSCLALETRIYQQNFAMLYYVQIKLSFIQTTTLIAEGISTNKASLRRFSSHRQDSSNNLCPTKSYISSESRDWASCSAWASRTEIGLHCQVVDHEKIALKTEQEPMISTPNHYSLSGVT